MNIGKLLGGLGRLFLFLLLMGGILVIVSAGDFVVSLKPVVSFDDLLDGTQVEAGDHVEGNVPYVLDYFASETTYTQYKDGSRGSSRASGNYYLIPTAEGFIGLKSRQADVDALDALTEETFDYMLGGEEPTAEVFMQGVVKAMDDEVAQYYREYLEDWEYTEEEIESFGEPLVIEYTDFTVVRVMFAVGVVLILLSVFLLWRNYKRPEKPSKLKKVEDLPEA